MKTKSTNRKKTDAQTHRIYEALKKVFPTLSTKESDVVYQKERFSIRVCVIDERFSNMGIAERIGMVNRAIKHLDSEDRADISMMVVLAPEEVEDDGRDAMQEFLKPSW